VPWKQRAVDRSPAVQRSRQRSIDQAREIIAAAERLTFGGDPDFTVQRLIAEAGIALQTFYRYFSGKDELLLAMLEEMIAKGAERIGALAAAEPDPLARLRSLVVQVAGNDQLTLMGPRARAITHLHFKLQEQYPQEIEDAIRPYIDLVQEAIEDAAATGYLEPLDPPRDALAITHLVLGVYHNASVGAVDDDPEATAEHIWQFCLGALRPTGLTPQRPARRSASLANGRPAKRAGAARSTRSS